MNYRHAFHAGNFADLAKHATLLALLDHLQRDPRPLTVIDTHAGAGVYDLTGTEARKTGEAQAGIERLMAADDAPTHFNALKAAVRRLNPKGPPRLYPGSPRLIADCLRTEDRLIACEVRTDDHSALRTALKDRPHVEVAQVDGWRHVLVKTPRPPSAALVLIDPPYEASDDRAQAARSVAAILKMNPDAVVVVWAPIKDLAAFDALVWSLEDSAIGRPVLIAESRLRPLIDPMRLNGAALIIINAPVTLAAPAREIANWVGAALGDRGEGRVRWGTDP
jgi:23S rRNA (adenine2030-N6)-methyltransferase